LLQRGKQARLPGAFIKPFASFLARSEGCDTALTMEVAVKSLAPERAASTGIVGLDEVLVGGFPRDHIYLIQGNPGVGKTTLALEFLRAGAALGEACVYLTLSETRTEIDAVAASHGWSLDGITLIELTALEQTLVLERENTLFESAEVELHETTRNLLEHIERIGPRRLVIDSLSELRLLAQGALRYRRQILGLKQYFADKRCTVLFLDDCTSDPSDLQLQSLAHGVLQLEQITPSYGEDRRRLRVVKLRGLRYRGGYHDYAIRTGGLAVFPRLVAAQHRGDFELVARSSGEPALDQLLGGGLDRGTSALIVGPAGAGKSVLATQFAVAAAARGESAAVFVFEEVAATWRARARALGLEVEEPMRTGRLQLQQIDPAEMGPGEFAHVVKSRVDAGVSLIVIDSLNGYLHAMSDAKALIPQLHELFSFLAQRGATTLFVLAQHGVLGRMQGPVDLSYLADTVLLLRYFEAAGRIRKAISVVKKRAGKHEDTIRELSLRSGGIALGEPLTAFTGVLSGVPRFEGQPGLLSNKT
jgi:circadian clock protein KaiC